MNTDIRLSCGFWSHPKTKRLVKALGLEAIRSLQVLWSWAAQYRPDGSMAGMDQEDIELAADWSGDEGVFFSACLGRWIDETPEGYVLHDWEDHNPWASRAEERSERARSAARKRWACDQHATGMPNACDQHASRNAKRMRMPCPSAPSPSPSPSPKDNKKTSSLRSDVCAELDEPAAALTPPSKVVGILPLADGTEFQITQDFVDELRPLYPGVDVIQALKAMKGWLLGNPKNRKTRSGVKRFVTNWLCREQDRASRPDSARASPMRLQDAKAIESANKAKRLKAEIMGVANGAHGAACEAANGVFQLAPAGSDPT